MIYQFIEKRCVSCGQTGYGFNSSKMCIDCKLLKKSGSYALFSKEDLQTICGENVDVFNP